MAIEAIRKFSAYLLTEAAEPILFLGRIGRSLWGRSARHQKLRWCDVRYYFDLCGAQSLPISLLISLLMGLILGLQAAIQLHKVGTDIFVADLVGFSVLKEFGPFMIAIIATGRAGSAFAAEIGTMKVNEEISALSTMGINPERFLVLPKLVAMLAAMPLLTIFGDFAGLFGGGVIGVWFADLPFVVYFERTCSVLNNVTFLLGVFKSVVFGVLITLTGCYYGFRSTADAQGVGRCATSAVVTSILLIVISDTVLARLYSFIGY